MTDTEMSIQRARGSAANLLRHRYSRFRHGLDHGRLVRERRRMALIEALNINLARRYTTQDGVLKVTLRHQPVRKPWPSIDLKLLNEIFREQVYKPPAAIDSRLSSSPALQVLDLGANIGLATLYFLARYPSSHVTSFEPDPANTKVFRRTIEANDFSGRVDLVESCAGVADGTVRFTATGDVFSHAAGPGEEGTKRPVRDVFPYLAQTDLLKLDIEGSEWPILMDPRLRECRTPAIVLEYHAQACPRPGARQYAEELLTAAGYLILRESENEEMSTGMLWATRMDVDRD